MKGIQFLYHSCQGESHKSSGKPCQDASFAVNNQRYAMAIVSDGHGGPRYFRSDKGSALAVEAARASISGFLNRKNGIDEIFKGKSFGSIGVVEPDKVDDLERSKKVIYEKLNWLTSSIINVWNQAIQKDALERPLTEWELENVEQKYLDEFRQKVESKDPRLEKFYGCTLMVYVQTPNFWFAFQIGDGKVVFFDVTDGKIEPSQLIPWDEKCFLNKTTSICDSDAGNEFRYAYCGNGHFPTAVFLGSDGIDDTFGDGDRLIDFYIRLYKEIIGGNKKALETLRRDLPELSRIGSKDDMSIACLYDTTRLKPNYLLMSQWQLERLNKEVIAAFSKSEQLAEKVAQFDESPVLTEKHRIERQYALNDLGRAKEAIERFSREKKAIEGADDKFKQKHKL